jgi:hypothetical protein
MLHKSGGKSTIFVASNGVQGVCFRCWSMLTDASILRSAEQNEYREKSPERGEETIMNPILLTVWAVLTACFLALCVYRGQLSRYEEDQLFLQDEVNHEQEFQTQLVRKLKRTEPLLKIVGAGAGLATVCAVGLYVYQAWQNLQ